MKKEKVKTNDFEENMTPFHAYVLGHLWADGYVLKNERKYDYRVSTKFSIEDSNDIKAVYFKTGNWNMREYNNCGSKQYYIGTNNKKFVLFLEKFNFLSKKNGANATIYYKIPDNLKKFFILGLFDGDGYVKNNKSTGAVMCIAGPYSQDWTFVEDFLATLNIKGAVRRVLGQKGNSSQIYISNLVDSLFFFEEIYSNNNLGLKRKRNRAIDLIKENNKNISFNQKTNKYSVEFMIKGERFRSKSLNTEKEAEEERLLMINSFEEKYKKYYLKDYHFSQKIINDDQECPVHDLLKNS